MAAKRTRKLLAWALCLCPLLSTGQVSFQRILGGTGNETATWVVEAHNGYLVSGHVTSTSGNQDALLIRLDATGAPVWQKRFGAAQSETFSCVAATSDGGYVAVGETKSFGAGNTDIYVVKVDASGNMLWSRTIGEASSNETAMSVVAMPEGGIIVSGTVTTPAQGSVRSIVSLLNSSGNTLWSRTYSSNSHAQLLSTYVNNSEIYLSGSLDGDAAFARLDLASGNVLGAVSYPSPGNESLSSQQPTNDGNIVLADFYSPVSLGEKSKLWAQKINPSNGQPIWSKTYARQNDNLRGRIEKCADGGFLLVPTYNDNDNPQGEALLAKIDANGNLQWAYNYGGNAADRLIKAAQTSDGGFIAVGDTKSGNGGNHNDILIIKTNGNGRIPGRCLQNGAIMVANVQTNSMTPTLTSSNFAQTSALTANPLSLNLQAQAFNSNLAPSVMSTVPLCPNQSLTLNGVKHFAPKMVRDTVTSLSGCDTIFLYNLTASPYPTKVHTIGLCPGQTYNVNGQALQAPATVVDTLRSLTGGCDTICIFSLKLLDQPQVSQAISFCPGEAVLIGGQTYTQPGTVVAYAPSSTGGCDTILTYTLSLRPQPARSATITFCPGESVLIGGNTYSQPATVQTTVPSLTGGCDTLVTYTLELRPQPTIARTVSFCPGTPVVIGGQAYHQPGIVTALLPSSGSGCDTLATITLVQLQQPERHQSIVSCAGQTVSLGGQTYNQPATVQMMLAGQNGACDTLATYFLEWAAQPTVQRNIVSCPGQTVTVADNVWPARYGANYVARPKRCLRHLGHLRPRMTAQHSIERTIVSCPGQTVTVGGQTYGQPATVQTMLQGQNGACDTLATYVLEWAAQPTRHESIGFCPGETVTIGGQAHTLPGIVNLNMPSATGGCDTLVTYTLQHLTPAPSHIAMNCPSDFTVEPLAGEQSMLVSYDLPVAASDCICPGLEVVLEKGIPSGQMFPLGLTSVCYAAKDNCGQELSCCFRVTVKSEQPCDIKVSSCVQYEVLSITADAERRHTYRIRVTNNCSSKLIYTAIQIPSGMTASEPGNFSTYTSPSDRKYLVRCPNMSPFYSIRFASVTDGISNGQSEIFEYTLPPQSAPTYINIVSKLDNQGMYEAHLNTFSCEIGITPAKTGNRSDESAGQKVQNPNSALLFPNPTSGILYADLSDWKGQRLTARVMAANGQLVQALPNLTAQDDVLRIELPQGMSAGTYFLELSTEKGEKETLRFVLKR
jgi:HYR domain.